MYEYIKVSFSINMVRYIDSKLIIAWYLTFHILISIRPFSLLEKPATWPINLYIQTQTM